MKSKLYFIPPSSPHLLIYGRLTIDNLVFQINKLNSIISYSHESRGNHGFDVPVFLNFWHSTEGIFSNDI